MSDTANGPGWWLASDGKWYPPHLHPEVGASPLPGGDPAPFGSEPSTGLPTFATGFTEGTPDFATPVNAADGSSRRRRRQLVLVAVSVVALALVGSAVVESQGAGSKADAAVVHAVDTAIAGKSADVTATGSIVTSGHTVSFTGSGEMDFANSAVSLTMGLDEAGQRVNEQAVYIGGMIYEQAPGISQVAPGKSWLSIDLSSLASQSSPSGTGLGGNPLAMLRALAVQGNTVTDLGTTTIGGQSVHGYSVTLNPSVIENEMSHAKLPAWMEQIVDQAKVSQGSQKVYIDSAGNLTAATLSITESVGTEGTVSANESLAFSNYGTPVSVTAPPADQVISLTDFLQLAG